MNKEVMNPEETAKYLGISKVTLYKFLRNGEIPARKIGRQWRIIKVALDKFLMEGEVK